MSSSVQERKGVARPGQDAESTSTVDACSHPRAGAAAVKLLEAARGADGGLTIAALGPLTNLALACKLDAGFPNAVKRLVVMGGAEARGNVTPHAEFNFHADPEAARLVRLAR